MFRGIQKHIDYFYGIIRVDLFINVSCACRPAYYLSKFYLREFSLPFDWMIGYKLEHITYFIKNDGAGFFCKISSDSQR